MKRGVKSKAEALALRLREEMGLMQHSALPMRELASHLKIVIATPFEIPGLNDSDLAALKNGGPGGWSGCCVQVGNGHLILHNPHNTPARQESDLAHEIAHVLYGHRCTTVDELMIQGVSFRRVDPEQEEEAAFLGGCLQLTKEALLRARFNGRSVEQIAAEYNASIQMVRYRLFASGADAIHSRSKKRYMSFRR